MDHLHKFYVVVASILLFVQLVSALPTFEDFASWGTIGSLVPGLSYLEALGPSNTNSVRQDLLRYVAIAGQRGYPGNITVETGNEPPLFYVYNGHLLYYHNSTTILPMNVHNATMTSQLPLQLRVGQQYDGVKGGNWRWQGTMLFYEQGSASNNGVYYSCQDTNGLMGLFLFLKPSPTPPGCTLFTIHSFNRDLQ